ncbi:esterase/lipase family protein [Bradyrhizobium sp.]|uniref:esterase/lipase family protein n=1 Tax=Bradyrhizobium sp. TaxID=376 RepID=UPI002CEB8D1D|nr:alpha/beta fold hydrolase [Bradyrhizobium sp.]HWX59782.1 alpha/beta fold hydrolase [Bradyrhizobium sp.]
MRDREKLRAGAVGRAGVVLLHGIGGTSLLMRTLEKSLRTSGFATLNLNYESRRKPLDQLACDIHPAITAFTADNAAPIHFVAHSMGGLLARVYVANNRPARLGRVVMLGTPNQGSELADLLKELWVYRAFYGPAGQQLLTAQDATLSALPPLDYEVGVISGNGPIAPISSRFILPWPNDGCVSVQSCMIDGMTDHVTVKTWHNGLVRNSTAIRQTLAFLREGRFERRLAA